MKTYFAYGSNMNVEQMKRRCPTAELIGTGTLEGYRLTFKGRVWSAVATIEPCTGSEVPIVVWKVYAPDEKALDRYEGYPTLYYKERLNVKLGAKTVKGFAYIMSDRYSVGLPSESYFQTIMDGYLDNAIDTKPLFNALYEVKDAVKVS